MGWFTGASCAGDKTWKCYYTEGPGQEISFCIDFDDECPYYWNDGTLIDQKPGNPGGGGWP
jgi:hypothetical protein